jgi:hypothetical protein
MSDVLLTCRTTWKRLGVPASARADLESELTADLAEAEADGVTAAAFVGGDPAGFARDWAVARGLVRARWRVLECVGVAGLVGAAGLAASYRVLRPAWIHQQFDPQGTAPATWSALYAHALVWFVVPVLVAVALFLMVVRDRLVVHTVVVLLVTSPLSLWAAAGLAARLDGAHGTGRGVVLLAALFAVLVGAWRAAVVAVSRRAARAADAELVTSPTSSP